MTTEAPEPRARDAEVVVIGAGPAGLFAARFAAGRGRRTLLLEKNRRPGLKILISGGGRCNLTTTRRGAELEACYGKRRGRWLRHALRAFPPSALAAHVEALGVPLQEEDLDKLFPVSGRAADVLEALVRDARAAGVEFVEAAPVRAIERASPAGGFVVHSAAGAPLRCARLVLATGGLSYPKTGATGDGYAIARALGHGHVATVPALAPLRVDLAWVHELQGIVVDARLELWGPDGCWLAERRRPTLFTHRGLSGPAPMDLSGFVEEVGGGCTLRIDFAPDRSRDELEAALREAAGTDGRRLVRHLLPAAIPERLRAVLARHAGVEEVVAAELRKDARRALVDAVKATAVRVDASLGFAAAEVTRGGVPLDEVDARTMESKLCPGLFLCGEILDVDGPIGGFNFQSAFATGRLAGLHA